MLTFIVKWVILSIDNYYKYFTINFIRRYCMSDRKFIIQDSERGFVKFNSENSMWTYTKINSEAKVFDHYQDAAGMTINGDEIIAISE